MRYERRALEFSAYGVTVLGILLFTGLTYWTEQCARSAPWAAWTSRGDLIVSTTTQETYFLPPTQIASIERGWRWWVTVVELTDGINLETYTSPEDCRAALQHAVPESSEMLLAER